MKIMDQYYHNCEGDSLKLEAMCKLIPACRRSVAEHRHPAILLNNAGCRPTSYVISVEGSAFSSLAFGKSLLWIEKRTPVLPCSHRGTVNRISRDPLLARLGDFFAVRLATLSVPLPSPAEKLRPPYFLGRRGEWDGERCQPDSEEIPRPR